MTEDEAKFQELTTYLARSRKRQVNLVLLSTPLLNLALASVFFLGRDLRTTLLTAGLLIFLVVGLVTIRWFVEARHQTFLEAVRSTVFQRIYLSKDPSSIPPG